MAEVTTAELRPGCVARCPGCAHRTLSAEQSEAQKSAWLSRRLAPWHAQLAPLQAVRGEARWSYRDRVTLAAAWEGGWCVGLRLGDEVLDITRCPVHSARVNAALALLLPCLPAATQFPLVYYVQSGAQLTLVVKSAQSPPLDWFDEALGGALAGLGIEGVWLHLHPAAGRRVLAKNVWRLLWGVPRSRDSAGLWHGPAAFAQLLPQLHARALDETAAFMQPQGGDSVVDLYCGNGSSLRRWGEAGAAAVGVELGGEALACAQLNAPGAQLLRGSCATRVPQLRQWAGARAEAGRLLYANPPRPGLEPAVASWIAEEFRPRALAYLSCSAGTLARDLNRLQEHGYRVARITPYDFFPQTYHVESLALLQRIYP